MVTSLFVVESGSCMMKFTVYYLSTCFRRQSAVYSAYGDFLMRAHVLPRLHIEFEKVLRVGERGTVFCLHVL